MPIDHAINGQAPLATPAARSVRKAMWRGFGLRCPACGQGKMFSSYLKINDRCPVCAEELHHHRADDAPPYFTMLIVGHIVVGSILAVEVAFAPPMWTQMTGWPILAVALSLLLLPRIKGTLVALQWAMRMHGFGAVGSGASVASANYDPAHQVAGDGQQP